MNESIKKIVIARMMRMNNIFGLLFVYGVVLVTIYTSPRYSAFKEIDRISSDKLLARLDSNFIDEKIDINVVNSAYIEYLRLVKVTEILGIQDNHFLEENRIKKPSDMTRQELDSTLPKYAFVLSLYTEFEYMDENYPTLINKEQNFIVQDFYFMLWAKHEYIGTLFEYGEDLNNFEKSSLTDTLGLADDYDGKSVNH